MAPRGSKTARRWIVALRNMAPRIATPKKDKAERVVYTDASWKSPGISAFPLGPSTFRATKYMRSITSAETGDRRKSTTAKTRYIYSLEMLAALGTFMEKGEELPNG